jgi:hypothetical protein
MQKDVRSARYSGIPKVEGNERLPVIRSLSESMSSVGEQSRIDIVVTIHVNATEGMNAIPERSIPENIPPLKIA